ncbi:MAG: hypothetical protein DRI39_00055 [Chloroflexi bacterium]|nr:MAG: hypothetical protein DRI39_00055 [Chloroflexota bacterium]RLC96311.1 MAG: hypothetical protein DRI40_03490 [Chloroflexota bacterium]
MGHYSSFVVKIWVDEEHRMSRGYVQHVGTQEAVHFLRPEKMMEFIMGHLSPPPSYSASTDEDAALGVTVQDHEARDERV